MRLNRYIAAAGAASRRGADELIEAGRVRIGDRTAALGDQVEPGDRVFIDGVEIRPAGRRIIIAYNKPAGVVCSAVSQAAGEVNIIDAIGYPERLFTVGRLDKPSRGLILLTNDGELCEEITRASNGHEKEYEVTVDKAVTDGFLRALERGVRIEFEDKSTYVTAECRVQRTGAFSFSIVLKEGKNRQIRRMCTALGYEVTDLRRVRIMDITLGDLPEGKYIELPHKV